MEENVHQEAGGRRNALFTVQSPVAERVQARRVIDGVGE